MSLSEFNAASNRFVSPSVYDNAGNLLTDKVGRKVKYDAEIRQVEFDDGVGITKYLYDGDGRRVKRISGGEETRFIYNGFGQLVAEYSTAGSSGLGTRYLSADHLGSTRLVTDASGTIKGCHDYLPFGGEIASTAGGRSGIGCYSYGVIDGIRQRFLGLVHILGRRDSSGRHAGVGGTRDSQLSRTTR